MVVVIEMQVKISLYAKVNEIAWPKEHSTENIDVGDDGSVCVTSNDEFGSVVLSPHRTDFTVCYLSALSRERIKEKNQNHRKANSRQHFKKDGHHKNEQMHGESSARDTSERGDNRIHIFEKMREDSKTPEYTKIAENDTSVGLNLSPITQASCVDSPGGISNASGSPFSIHTSGENCNAKFRPFSTPTEGLDAKENGSYNNNAEGSFLGETYGKKPVDFTQDIQSQHHYFKPIAVCKSEMKASHDCGDVGRACLEQEETTLATKCEDEICGGISSCSSQEGDSQTQVRYTWLTRHMSCDECHSSFGHVVKLAKEAAETGIVVDMKGSKKTEKKSTNISSLRQINKKHCIMSPVPSSLPLVCPGQHLHKLFGNNIYDDGKNPVEDPTTFSFGRLKVLLIDGVIFRIVRLQSMKCIEVYPGDGSVIASQGMTGHFFQHIIPIGNKLEERTYSLKSPPGQAVVGGHSIKGLLNRANRFLAHVRQEENMPSSLGLCCWKHEDVILTEPGTTTTLEECEIPGYGKFTARSNGEVRITFTDRTCLDMAADFSSKLAKRHEIEKTSKVLVDKKLGVCRLLLPNGNYQMINVNDPRQYKRYVSLALEWIDWVNSPSKEREQFYKDRPEAALKQSVEKELQKIQCFNYIVDKTVLKSDMLENPKGASSQFVPSNKPGPGILRNTDQVRAKESRAGNFPPRTVQIHSPNASQSSSISTESSSKHSLLEKHIPSAGYSESGMTNSETFFHRNVRPVPIGQDNSDNRMSELDGFNSVRQALMKTSNFIKDIDHLLDTK
ncbi:uncharacterized protein LOC128219272 [Mya arenaria]|uniref:uncharacterized protein LOC128219272 n=1 Tax=Mya arenaria TaxID=6604 RepID=UPI0022E3E38D|nr:uncharacterized protein LOC128219272 [Mya arenaria]